MTRLACLLAALLALALPVAAQNIPDPVSDTISDFADLLPPEAEARLAGTLSAARAETGIHIVVATIGTRADYGGAGESIEDFATRWFNTWGIGDATRNDGILILVARADREMRIALGAGFPVEYDNAAGRVIREAVLPEFREERYAAGIAAGAEAAIERLARPFAAGAAPPKAEGQGNPLPLFLAAMAAMLAWNARRRLADLALRFRRCPACGNFGLRVSRNVLTEATDNTPGRGERLVRCPSCGDERRESYEIPVRSRAPGGRGGGFGGGRSSGGGASGRW